MAATKATPVTVTLKQERITKNTVRYQEVTENDLATPMLGQIYVPKATLSALGANDVPDEIVVTVSLP